MNIINVPTSTYAMPNVNINSGKGTEFKSDFQHNKKSAEEVSKQFWKPWTDTLTNPQKEALENINKPTDSKDINSVLDIYGENTNLLPVDFPEENNEVKENINNIDEALTSSLTKIPQTTVVYLTIAGEDFNDTNYRPSNNSKKIDRDKVKSLSSNFKYGISEKYMKVSLSENKNDDSGEFKWRIEVPKGTNMGYLNPDSLILQRGIGLDQINLSVIEQNGKEYIRVNAKLVSKQKINQQIIVEKSKLNNSWNKTFGMPAETEFIDFRLNNQNASLVVLQANSLLNELRVNVPNRILKRVFEFMREKDGKIIFTDSNMVGIKEGINPLSQTSKTLQENFFAKGLYNRENRTIIFKGASTSINGLKGMQCDDFIHEFAHALDYYVGKMIFSKPNVTLSDSLGFQDVFNAEKNKLTEYAKINHHEFWAEACVQYFSNKPEIREKFKVDASETFNFIDEIIQELKK